jgi:hypothetical protein
VDPVPDSLLFFSGMWKIYVEYIVSIATWNLTPLWPSLFREHDAVPAEDSNAPWFSTIPYPNREPK